MKYKSCAQWHPGHVYYPVKDITTDIHDTKEQAEAVCRMLERDGLGGERIHFPIKTWVEEQPETLGEVMDAIPVIDDPEFVKYLGTLGRE